MRRTIRSAAVLLVSLLAIACAVEAQTETREWIRFETIDQSALPIVRARLNGSGGHRLVLDAGFNDFVLDTTITEGLGLNLASRGESVEIDFYGRPERVPVAYLQSLEIGDVRVEMARTLLVEGEDGTGIGGLRSYGRIGRDLLEPLRLTVHYPRRLLYLEASPETDVPEGGVTYRSAGRFLLVPVRLEREGAEIEVDFVLDAGTSTSLVDREWAEDNGFAADGAVHANLPALTIGGLHEKELPVLTGVMSELPYEGRPVGVIGADVLLRLSVTYDFARDLLWLVSVDGESS